MGFTAEERRGFWHPRVRSAFVAGYGRYSRLGTPTPRCYDERPRQSREQHASPRRIHRLRSRLLLTASHHRRRLDWRRRNRAPGERTVPRWQRSRYFTRSGEHDRPGLGRANPRALRTGQFRAGFDEVLDDRLPTGARRRRGTTAHLSAQSRRDNGIFVRRLPPNTLEPRRRMRRGRPYPTQSRTLEVAVDRGGEGSSRIAVAERQHSPKTRSRSRSSAESGTGWTTHHRQERQHDTENRHCGGEEGHTRATPNQQNVAETTLATFEDKTFSQPRRSPPVQRSKRAPRRKLSTNRYSNRFTVLIAWMCEMVED